MNRDLLRRLERLEKIAAELGPPVTDDEIVAALESRRVTTREAEGLFARIEPYFRAVIVVGATDYRLSGDSFEDPRFPIAQTAWRLSYENDNHRPRTEYEMDLDYPVELPDPSDALALTRWLVRRLVRQHGLDGLRAQVNTLSESGDPSKVIPSPSAEQLSRVLALVAPLQQALCFMESPLFAWLDDSGRVVRSERGTSY